MGKKAPKGWDPTYTRRSFFPYWRSVLGARCHVKVYPAYAAADLAQLRNKLSNKPPDSSQSLGVAARIRQPATTGQSRMYSTAAIKTFAKLLKHA